MKPSPYTLIGSSVFYELADHVNCFVTQGYEPIGTPFMVTETNDVGRPTGQCWYQAMYREPDLFDETPTTPQSHRDAVDDVILEAFYRDRLSPEEAMEVAEAVLAGNSGECGMVLGASDVNDLVRFHGGKGPVPELTLPKVAFLRACLSIRKSKPNTASEPDKYPGHPDYKGEVIRTDDQMESRGCKPGSYRDLQEKNAHLERRAVALWKAADILHEAVVKAEKERDEALNRAERTERSLELEWWPHGGRV